jgi:hypothetical protein
MSANEMLNTKTFILYKTEENEDKYNFFDTCGYGFVCVSPQHPLYEIDKDNRNNFIRINSKKDVDRINEYQLDYLFSVYNRKYYIDDLIKVHVGIISCGYVNNKKHLFDNDDIPGDWWYFMFSPRIPVTITNDINEELFNEEFLEKETKYFEKEIQRVSELLLELDSNSNNTNYKMDGYKDKTLKDVNFNSGDIVTHIKTGHKYKILHIGYRADTNIPYKSQIPQIIYTRIEDNINEVWTRNLHQFKLKFVNENMGEE